MTPLFTIDGLVFRAGVTSLARRAELRDGKNASTSMSGRNIRDLIGTYFHYTLTLSTLDMEAGEYDAMYEVLSAPVESHGVQLPFGQGVLGFEAYITGLDDALELSDEGGNLWGNLTVNFTAMEPQRLPEVPA